MIHPEGKKVFKFLLWDLAKNPENSRVVGEFYQKIKMSAQKFLEAHLSVVFPTWTDIFVSSKSQNTVTDQDEIKITINFPDWKTPPGAQFGKTTTYFISQTNTIRVSRKLF